MFKLLKIASNLLVPVIAFIIYKKEKEKPERKDYKNKLNHDLYNVSSALISNIVSLSVRKYLANVFTKSEEKELGLLNKIKISELNRNIVAILLIDLYMYIWHRANHKNKILWYFHKFHHEDTNMSATTAIRFHSGEIVLSEIFRTLILIPFGITKRNIEYYNKILLPVIIFHHSNIRINDKSDQIIKKLIASPGFHRLHHSDIKDQADSNYASVFSFWDRLFKTYKKNPASNYIEFGISEHN